MTMAPEVGTELVNPKAGTRTLFTATAQSTGGAYVEVEATYPAHGQKPRWTGECGSWSVSENL